MSPFPPRYQTSFQSIGDKIFYLRRKSGMTQEELAGLIHVSHAMISYWEKGHRTPNWRDIINLSGAFGLSVQSFIHGIKEP